MNSCGASEVTTVWRCNYSRNPNISRGPLHSIIIIIIIIKSVCRRSLKGKNCERRRPSTPLAACNAIDACSHWVFDSSEFAILRTDDFKWLSDIWSAELSVDGKQCSKCSTMCALVWVCLISRKITKFSEAFDRHTDVMIFLFQRKCLDWAGWCELFQIVGAAETTKDQDAVVCQVRRCKGHVDSWSHWR